MKYPPANLTLAGGKDPKTPGKARNKTVSSRRLDEPDA